MQKLKRVKEIDLRMVCMIELKSPWWVRLPVEMGRA